MSKPPGAKEASRQAQEAARKACDLLEDYKQQAKNASELFESLHAAVKEAKALAVNIEKAVARHSQPTASAVREAAKRLRTGANFKAAKAASKKAANELQTAAAAVIRADDVLRPVPALFPTKPSPDKENPFRSSRKRAAKQAAKAVKAVEAASKAARDEQANLKEAIIQLRAVNSLEAAADSAAAAERAADGLEAVAALIKKAADSIEATDEVKWPTTYIWVEAFKWIAELAKVVRENAELARAANSGTAEDEEWVRQADEARTNAEKCEKEARDNYDSAIAVEVLLNVEGFFYDHRQQIFDRLEECHNIALQAISNRDMLFIAESLPIINGIIHVGSARKQLKSATRWVERNWGSGEAHPRIVLSALLFKYVTGEGAKAFIGQNPPHEKENVWKQIQDRVNKLL